MHHYVPTCSLVKDQKLLTNQPAASISSPWPLPQTEFIISEHVIYIKTSLNVCNGKRNTQKKNTPHKHE